MILLALIGKKGAAQDAPRAWVLRGVTVVGVVRGDTLPGAEIVVRGDRIACVARAAACEVPSAAGIDAGVEPPEVLRGATLHAAKALRRYEDYGSVEAGKRADLGFCGRTR